MRHLCTLAMFHTQHAYSLLLLIHVQIQRDLAITRDICVNIYLLNCLNLFLKYKIGTCLMCLWIQECFASRVKVWFECLTCCLDACLSSHLVAFSSYVFSLPEKPLFYILDSFLIESRQIPLLLRFLGLTSIASRQMGRSIEPKSCALYLLDTSSIDSRSLEVGFFSIASQQLLNLSRPSCMHFFSHVLHFSILLSSIASCFITFMHLYGFLVPP